MSSCSVSSNIRSQLFAPIVYLESSGTRIAFTIDTANTGYTIGSGITGGTIIRYDPSTLSYLPSNAKQASTAEVLGVVESLKFSSGATVFTIISSGLINYPNLNSVPDLYTTDGSCTPETTLSGGEGGKDILFLSDGCSGSVQFIEPSTPGAIVKPVMQVLKTESYNAMVLNYIGYEVGESAQVEYPIDGFVGQIIYIPNSTTPSTIPFGYLRVDTEQLVDYATYSDLFNLFGTDYGTYWEELTIGGQVNLNYNNAFVSQSGVGWAGTVVEITVGNPGKIVVQKLGFRTDLSQDVELTVAGTNLRLTATNSTIKKFTVPFVATQTQTYTASTTGARIVDMIPYMKAKNNLSYVSFVDTLKLQGLCLGSILDVEATLDLLCADTGVC